MRSRPCPCGIVPIVGLGKRCTYPLQMGGRESSSCMAYSLREGGGWAPLARGAPLPPGARPRPRASWPTGAQGSPGQPGPTAGSGEPDPGAGPGPASPGQGGALPGPPCWARAANGARAVRGPPHPTMKGLGVGGGLPRSSLLGEDSELQGSSCKPPLPKNHPPYIDIQFT
jgi:hypothetical protein